MPKTKDIKELKEQVEKLLERSNELHKRSLDYGIYDVPLVYKSDSQFITIDDYESLLQRAAIGDAEAIVELEALPPEINYKKDLDALKEREAFNISIEELKELNEALKDALEQKPKRTYRTAAKAAKNTLPEKIAIPTAKEYQNGMGLCQVGNAYMLALPTDMQDLKFENGKLQIYGQEQTVATLKELGTNKDIVNLNIPVLRFFYSILAEKYVNYEDVNGVITCYLPDLMDAYNGRRNYSPEARDAFINDLQSFHRMCGVIYVPGYKEPSKYPILNFEGYNTKTNEISFSSPYMAHFLESLFAEENREQLRYKNGKLKLDGTDGTVKLRAVNSFAPYNTLYKERDNIAQECVFRVIQTIDQAGYGVKEPKISARRIFEEVPQFKEAVESADPTQRTRIIKRVFKNTWKYLDKHTDLRERYESIQLPDPEKPENIPTQKTLDTKVFVFKHAGKKHARGSN